MTLNEQVTTALDGLGPTSLDIAESLCNKGIRAWPLEGDRCALSVYLRQQFPELVDVSTGLYCVNVMEFGRFGPAWSEDVPLNLQQRAFIQEFDRGYYPDLIA